MKIKHEHSLERITNLTVFKKVFSLCCRKFKFNDATYFYDWFECSLFYENVFADLRNIFPPQAKVTFISFFIFYYYFKKSSVQLVIQYPKEIFSKARHNIL